MIAKTILTLASLIVVAAVIGTSISIYLSSKTTIVKIGYWHDGTNFIYSKLIETIDKINIGSMSYKNITYTTQSSTSSLLTSFDSYNDVYGVTDYGANLVIEFNSDWKEQISYSITFPAFIKEANDEFFVARDGGIGKYLQDTTLITWYSCADDYYSIYYDLSIYGLVCARTDGLVIHDFDLNLVRSIPIDHGIPTSVYGYDGKYYVSTVNNVSQSGLVTIQGNNVLNYFEFTENCVNSTIKQILFDKQGFVAIVCQEEKAIYIYHNTGKYTGRSLKTTLTPTFINYDSQGRFVLLEEKRILLYSNNS